MRIAVASDDGKTISRHFGRASYYLVFTVEVGEIINKELRDKASHQQFAHERHGHDPDDHRHEHNHGFGTHADQKHTQMIEPIRDCDAVLVRGMGRGAYLAVQEANIRPIVTEIEDAEEAVQAYIDGTLVHHLEWLH